jgi:hypothetical protein
MLNSIVLSLLLFFAPQSTETGSVQGTVKRAGASEVIANAQIRLEGGPADPRAVQDLSRAVGNRGIPFAPKKIGTVDDVIAEVIDAAAAQGVGPGFPSMNDALTNFRAANLARFVGTSDREGKFTIKEVPPGSYLVHADREGFVDPVLAGSNIRVNVTAGGVASLDVAMPPGGVVTGHIRDSSGQPVQNVEVQALRLTYQNGYPFLQSTLARPTDDQGEYRLFWLTPGEYYIALATRQDPGATNLVRPRIFYPGSLDLNAAAPVNVRSGDQLSGIDINVREERVYTISGTLSTTIPPKETAAMAAVFNPPGTRVPTLMVVYSDPNQPDPSKPVGTVTLNPVSGTFETIGLLPGAYEFYARIPESNAGGGAGLAWAHIPVEIRDQNLKGVALTVNPSVNLAGNVTVDGKAPQAGSGARVFLQPSSNNVKIGVYNAVAQRPVLADAEGRFTIPGVPPGPYHVELAGGLSPELYVADILQGPVSIFDDGINVTSKAPDPLLVRLKTGAGAVEGIVQDAAGKPVASATVVLVPNQNRRQNRVLFRTATSDAAGRFSIKSVSPGIFKIFAWQQPIAGGAYYNSGFLSKYEEKGRAVTVVERATVNQQITAIP